VSVCRALTVRRIPKARLRFGENVEGVSNSRARNTYSDKKTLCRSFQPKRKFSAVRITATCAGLTPIVVARRPAAVVAGDSTFICSHNKESLARHHSRWAIRNSDRHHHFEEAITHERYARGLGIVNPSA
jgi:hypothetical protein